MVGGISLNTYLESYAEVVELVDTLDLGSSTARCEGSSPFFGTKIKTGCYDFCHNGFFVLVGRLLGQNHL